MFIGHFGAGLGARGFAPGVSLGMLFVAIAWVGHVQWLLVARGYWIDRHRVRGEVA